MNSLESHLGYWLRFVSNHVSHSFAEKLSGHGVTVAEWVILRELYDRDETSPSVVAEATGLTRGAVSKLIDRLAAKELVSRQVSAGDRRYQQVELAERGRNLVPALVRAADENDHAFFGHLSDAQRATLQQILRDLVVLHNLKTIPTE